MMPKTDNKSSLKKRFDAKCGLRNERGCIPWIGATNGRGYGQIRVGAASDGLMLAHRASWILNRGPIPSGLFLLHECDNPRCVNVEHLRLGTQKENMTDAWARGRCTGEHLRKLPNDKHASVFAMRDFGMTHQAIADVFLVSRPLISNILSGTMRRAYSATGKEKCH
jgi:hypothetical protein